MTYLNYLNTQHETKQQMTSILSVTTRHLNDLNTKYETK